MSCAEEYVVERLRHLENKVENQDSTIIALKLELDKCRKAQELIRKNFFVKKYSCSEDIYIDCYAIPKKEKEQIIEFYGLKPEDEEDDVE